MRILFLGTAGAVPSKDRDNTSIAFELNDGIFLVDCPGSVIQKMLKVNWNPMKLKWILISHVHVDHVYGLPSLIHILWLMKRKEKLLIMTTSNYIETVQQMIDMHGFREKNNMFAIEVVEIPVGEKLSLSDEENFEIFPVDHSIYNVGIELNSNKTRIIYSNDTEPTDEVMRRSENADVLIHECNNAESVDGKTKGHSTAMEVGKLAGEANVKKLYLVHLGKNLFGKCDVVLNEAKNFFEGEIYIPNDLDVINT